MKEEAVQCLIGFRLRAVAERTVNGLDGWSL
jgi:hypothetical protein